MTPAQQTYAIFGGIAAILVLASAIGAWLKRGYGAGSGADMIQNLNDRIRAWWWMVGVMGAALLLGRGALIVLYALASMFALRVFITITPALQRRHLHRRVPHARVRGGPEALPPSASRRSTSGGRSAIASSGR